MRKQATKRQGLKLCSHWQTYVLCPNKFLGPRRSYYTQRVPVSVIYLLVLLSIESEKRCGAALDMLDDSPYNRDITAR